MDEQKKYECPDDEKLYTLVFGELCSKERASLDEHFLVCDLCTQKVRAIYEAYSIIVSSSVPKNSYNNSSIDVAVLAAASSEELSAAETRSVEGKYIIRLTPFLHSSKSIIEVQLMDKTAEGILVIDNKEERIFEAQIKNGFAVQEIEKQIDLSFMMIKILIR